MYPRLTLVLQSLGSIVVALEAVLLLRPDVVFETVGFAFTYPVFRLFGSKVICYTHYPTISSDMLTLVENRTISFNNAKIVANSALLTRVKLAYYWVFGCFYMLAGKCASRVMVNSTWTFDHIRRIWRVGNLDIVYPPCDVSRLLQFPLHDRKPVVVSVAQFRPEKNQILQVEAFAHYKKSNPLSKAKLMIVGNVRNSRDEEICSSVKKRIAELGQSDIEIIQNIDYTNLLQLLKTSKVGLHTMANEHFGINVVEFMVFWFHLGGWAFDDRA
jgi:alpha-1,2-mannosyltransferase